MRKGEPISGGSLELVGFERGNMMMARAPGYPTMGINSTSLGRNDSVEKQSDQLEGFA